MAVRKRRITVKRNRDNSDGGGEIYFIGFKDVEGYHFVDETYNGNTVRMTGDKSEAFFTTDKGEAAVIEANINIREMEHGGRPIFKVIKASSLLKKNPHSAGDYVVLAFDDIENETSALKDIDNENVEFTTDIKKAKRFNRESAIKTAKKLYSRGYNETSYYTWEEAEDIMNYENRQNPRKNKRNPKRKVVKRRNPIVPSPIPFGVDATRKRKFPREIYILLTNRSTDRNYLLPKQYVKGSGFDFNVDPDRFQSNLAPFDSEYQKPDIGEVSFSTKDEDTAYDVLEGLCQYLASKGLADQYYIPDRILLEKRVGF